MNYRHAFHAGNFADVVKHATLALLIEEESIGDLLGALSALGRLMDEAAIFPARPMTASCQNPRH